jgi:DNA-directed RNA polymerase specialized sigma24 family protein
VCSTEGDILSEVQDKENFTFLIKKLFAKLSPFEKQVFVLYAKQFTYEEIAERITIMESWGEINIKGVDNALSRVKAKSHTITKKLEDIEKNKEKNRKKVRKR